MTASSERPQSFGGNGRGGGRAEVAALIVIMHGPDMPGLDIDKKHITPTLDPKSPRPYTLI